MTYGKKLSNTTELEGGSPFEIDVGADKDGKTITVIEVDAEGKSVAYGTATISVNV